MAINHFSVQPEDQTLESLQRRELAILNEYYFVWNEIENITL